MAFGTGKTFNYVDTMKIAEQLGEEKCTCPSLDDCDTMSSFAGREKGSTIVISSFPLKKYILNVYTYIYNIYISNNNNNKSLYIVLNICINF